MELPISLFLLALIFVARQLYFGCVLNVFVFEAGVWQL
jgi:hypothetical protein